MNYRIKKGLKKSYTLRGKIPNCGTNVIPTGPQPGIQHTSWQNWLQSLVDSMEWSGFGMHCKYAEQSALKWHPTRGRVNVNIHTTKWLYYMPRNHTLVIKINMPTLILKWSFFSNVQLNINNEVQKYINPADISTPS